VRVKPGGLEGDAEGGQGQGHPSGLDVSNLTSFDSRAAMRNSASRAN